MTDRPGCDRIILAANKFCIIWGDNMTDSQKLDLILSKIQGLEMGMQGLEARMQTLERDLQEVKQKISNIELTLENEIRVNIRRIAEGHLDISRHLNDAIRVDSEKEMLVVRVNILESELRRVKERLDRIA
jgi:chaperonin cofactor prefoldin